MKYDLEHVLVAGSYRWPVYAPAFTEALERLGVKVSRFYFERYLDGFFPRLQVRVGTGPHIAALNLDLRSAVKCLRPTICLVWTGLVVWPSTIRHLARHCWVTSYTNDKFRSFFDSCPRDLCSLKRFFRKFTFEFLQKRLECLFDLDPSFSCPAAVRFWIDNHLNF